MMTIQFQALRDRLVLGTARGLALLRHPRLTRWHWRYDGRRHLPDPALPTTAHEKWFWRKIFDRSPVFVQVTDKLGLRDWLGAAGIRIATPEVLWVGDDARDIPDALWQTPIVIKGNHGCGMNIFVPAPPENRETLIAEANGFLGKRHGRREVQWAYYDVTPRLFVERFIPNMRMDLKFYCFGDRIGRLVAIYDRFTDTSADIWIPDENGTLRKSEAPAVVSGNRANAPLPDIIDEAMAKAREIGAHFDHVRVDILSDGRDLWLGELTIYNMGGHFRGVSPEEIEPLNEAWDIRRSWFLTTPQRGWRRVYAEALRRALNAR